MVGRLVLAVSSLAGFYVLALGVIAGLVALTAWLVVAGEPFGALSVGGALLTEFMIVAVVVALLLSLRARVPPPGVELDEHAAPELWRLIRELAVAEDVRAPDTVRLVAAANAWVFDDTRFWGLRRGKRHLDVGMPLLLGMTVDQLTAVLAHELGHYSREDTRLYEVVYRGRESIVDVLDGLTATPWRALLRGYFHLYRLATSALLREREWAADRFAAAATDGPTVAAALRELNAIDRAWGAYLAGWVVPHRFRDHVPDDICGGFQSFLAVTDLARHRAELPARQDRWDSHPPLAERVATLARLPARTAAADPAPAARLVPDLPDLGPRLDEVTFPVGGRERVPFADFAVGVREEEARADADVLYRAAGGATGLAGVLDLLATGHREHLAGEVTRATATSADPDSTARTLATHLESAIAVAAVDSRAAWWRFSWETGVRLVDDRGRPFAEDEEFGLAGLAATACAGAASEVAAVRTRLTELGVDLTAGRVSATTPRHELLGMMAAVTANGRPHDLLILSTGLVLLAVGRYDNSRERLAYLADHLRSGVPADHGWFVPYEDVRAARRLHRTRGSVLFTLRDGTFLRIEETVGAGRYATGRDDPRQVLRDVVASVTATGAPATGTGRGRPAVVPRAVPDETLAAAERAWRTRNRTVLGLLFLLPGVLLTLIGLTRGAAENTHLVGSGIPFGGAGLVLLYLAHRDRRPRRVAEPRTRWYALHRVDKASLYGLIGLFGIAAFPVGTIWSVLAVREARKVGRRPPLTAVVSLGLQLLLVAGVVVALL